jgi:hypothetical protein
MEIICQDYYFYPDGNFSTQKKVDSATGESYTDINQLSKHIRLYGTLDQINKAGDKYMQRTGQKLDEAYNYCVNSKESVWYNKSENEIISANLQTYAKQYNKNEALIINII